MLCLSLSSLGLASLVLRVRVFGGVNPPSQGHLHADVTEALNDCVCWVRGGWQHAPHRQHTPRSAFYAGEALQAASLRQPRPGRTAGTADRLTSTRVPHSQRTVGQLVLGRPPSGAGAVDVARLEYISKPLDPVESFPPVFQTKLPSIHPPSNTPTPTVGSHPAKKPAPKHHTSSHKAPPHRKPSHPSRPAAKPAARSFTAVRHAVPTATLPPAVDPHTHEEMEMDVSGSGGRPTSLMDAVERRQQLPTCGGMPPFMVSCCNHTTRYTLPLMHTFGCADAHAAG